jgi:hypothetical protein
MKKLIDKRMKIMIKWILTLNRLIVLHHKNLENKKDIVSHGQLQKM